MRYLLSAYAAFILFGGPFSFAQGPVAGSRIVLKNSLVRRVLEKDNDVWRTRAFARAGGSDELQVQSDEFLILLMDDTRLKLEDYRAEGDPVTTRKGNSSVVEINYVPRGKPHAGAPRSVRVEYSLGEEPYLRKSLTLTMAAGEAVDRLEVERFKTRPACDLGGIGEPIFIGDSWFTGLEYPGSYTDHCNGLVTLAHYPGLARKSKEKGYSWVIQSKSAVIGTGLKGDPLELVFSDYLDSIRQPARKHFLINAAWTFPWDRGKDEYLTYFDAVKRNLDAYGVKLDSLQVDLLKYYKSFFLAHPDIFPEGYGPLSRALEERGSSLSFWLSVGGTGLDTKWMAEQGYEMSNGPFQDIGGYYCIAAPKYNALIRECLPLLFRDTNGSYYKHDFQQTQCSAEGHGHLPTTRHGFEANLDATLEILDYERRLKPDIVQDIHSYNWMSPWWLMHSSYLYMGVSDAISIQCWPQPSIREQEMDGRDDHFFKISRKWRNQVPMSAMITHALIRNEMVNPGGDQETLRQWSDAVMMVCGRGLQLIDCYFTPGMLSPDFWRALGESTRWWQDNYKVLERTTMVGGNPRDGELYGYMHWKDDRGILCLRNPDVREQPIRVPFDKSVFYRGKADKAFRGRVIYPYVEDLPMQFKSGEPILLSVPGYSVMLIEFRPGNAPQVTPADVAGNIRGNGSVVPADRDWRKPGYYEDSGLSATATVSVQVPSETMDRCDLLLIMRSNGKLPDLTSITINGQPAQARTSTGSLDLPRNLNMRDTDPAHWTIRSIDLRVFRGKNVQMVTATSRAPVPFTMDAWVVADRPVKASAVPQGNLPPVLWQNFRRQTVQLLSYKLSVVPLHH